MARKARVRSIEIEESSQGRFVVETYDDGSVVRRAVEQGAKPRRRPRKPFVRVWRRDDSSPAD